MSGTATIKNFIIIEDMTAVPQPYPGTITYTVTGVDEVSPRYADIAATTAVTVDIGSIDTVTGFWIYVVTGGTTILTGISVDLINATWAAAQAGDVIYQGECRFYRPPDTTFSIKNLDDDVATVSYLVFGDNE